MSSQQTSIIFSSDLSTDLAQDNASSTARKRRRGANDIKSSSPASSSRRGDRKKEMRDTLDAAENNSNAVHSELCQVKATESKPIEKESNMSISKKQVVSMIFSSKRGSSSTNAKGGKVSLNACMKNE